MNTKRTIDLRSDTITTPTKEMRRAMYEAEVGDDVFREDKPTSLLECYAAEILKKEAALFVPTGTFANQLAILTSCKRGEEVVLSNNSHILQWESGAPAVIGAVQLRPVLPSNDYLCWNEINNVIRHHKGNIHCPDTSLVCIENALAEGNVQPIDAMKEIFQNCNNEGLSVHTDGARLFNAATALNIDPHTIAENTDSLMFCLSKGLGAPVGSLLVGDKYFIEKARRNRKLMGGGMRQVGVLAAPGLIALKNMRHRLVEDHEKAYQFAKFVNKFEELFEVNLNRTKINIVNVNIKFNQCNSELLLLEKLSELKILALSLEKRQVRFVFSHQTNDEDFSELLSRFQIVSENILLAIRGSGSNYATH